MGGSSNKRRRPRREKNNVFFSFSSSPFIILPSFKCLSSFICFFIRFSLFSSYFPSMFFSFGSFLFQIGIIFSFSLLTFNKLYIFIKPSSYIISPFAFIFEFIHFLPHVQKYDRADNPDLY